MADEDKNHPFKSELQGPQGATNPFVNERVGFTQDRIDLRRDAEEVSDADMQALREAKPSQQAHVPYSPLRRQEMPEDQRSMWDWKTSQPPAAAPSEGEFETKNVCHLGASATQGFMVDGPPQPL